MNFSLQPMQRLPSRKGAKCLLTLLPMYFELHAFISVCKHLGIHQNLSENWVFLNCSAPLAQFVCLFAFYEDRFNTHIESVTFAVKEVRAARKKPLRHSTDSMAWD